MQKKFKNKLSSEFFQLKLVFICDMIRKNSIFIFNIKLSVPSAVTFFFKHRSGKKGSRTASTALSTIQQTGKDITV